MKVGESFFDGKLYFKFFLFLKVLCKALQKSWFVIWDNVFKNDQVKFVEDSL